jgi:putative DNA primase/helicase
MPAIGDSTPVRIPCVAASERDMLLAVVRSLDAMPPPAAALQTGQPRAVSARRTDWADILEPAGWNLVYQSGRTRYWRRPGKSFGVSATTGRADDRDRLWVFSTSSAFETERPVTKFHAYAVLNHDGDHGAAARALREAGFGGGRGRGEPPATGTASPESDGDGLAVPATSRTVRVGEEAPPHVAAWGPTEDGLARALVAHHRHELRYCPQRGRWLLWDGHRWAWDDAERHREFVRVLARDLPSAGRWRRFRSQALSAGGVSGVIRMARTDPAITVSMTQLDARPYELATPGGVVDLRTGALSASDPAGAALPTPETL